MWTLQCFYFFSRKLEKDGLKSCSQSAQMFLFCSYANRSKSKSQFLFHKNLPPRDFSIMTLTVNGQVRLNDQSEEWWFRPEICGKYFLLFPQKTSHQRKLKLLSVYISIFEWRHLQSYIKTFCHLAIWQNWCFGPFYQWKNWKVNTYQSQFSLVRGFFWANERKYFLHILGLRRVNTSFFCQAYTFRNGKF